MWLEATLTADDVANIATQFSPLELRIGTDGRLNLSRPSTVTFVPERGVEIVCNAKLEWPLLGMHVPVSMAGLTILVCPAVEARPDGCALVLRLGLVRAGVSSVGLIDDRVTALLNVELEKHHVELAWNFSRTLTHTFPLPGALLSAETVSLAVRSGTTTVTRDAMALAVLMGASVRRRVDAVPSPEP